MRFLIALLMVCCATLGFCASPTAAQLLQQSEQVLVVMTSSWDAYRGKIQLYQRPGPKAAWEKAGAPVEAVVGINGLGWGVELAHHNWPGPVKKEGDNRSPVGVFRLGPAFGFETTPSEPIKLAYFPLTKATVCVDDVNSGYYNQILERSKITRPDWHSSEAMRQIPLYNWGSVIQYNRDPAVAGRGSCIFLHIWRSEQGGTAGCVALNEQSLRLLLSQLNSAKNPVIAILTEPAYLRVKNIWDLPILTEQS